MPEALLVLGGLVILRLLWRMADANERGTRRWWAARCNICRGRGECYHWY